jgi:hypothetical protein
LPSESGGLQLLHFQSAKQARFICVLFAELTILQSKAIDLPLPHREIMQVDEQFDGFIVPRRLCCRDQILNR